MKKLLPLALAIFIGFSASAQDVVRLKNGNELNGEVKSMNQGVLVMETNYSDSDFQIDWSEVEYLKTESVYMISLSKEKLKGVVLANSKQDSIGDRVNSNLESDPNNSQKVLINTPYGKKSVNLAQIVYLNSFSDSFFSRLSASVEVGFTLTKANNLRQFNIGSRLGYEADRWGANAGLNIVNSTQDIDDTIHSRVHRLDANVGFNWYLPKDFYLAASANFLEDDDMNLDLRSTVKAGLGYYILRTNSLYWNFEGGVAYNNEKYFPDPTIDPNPRNSSEGYISSELNLYDIGDLNLFTNVVVYPSITESGRLRTDFKFEAKYDLPYDLYVKAGTTLNYDNQPGGSSDEMNYVITSGIGWEL